MLLTVLDVKYIGISITAIKSAQVNCRPIIAEWRGASINRSRGRPLAAVVS